MKLKLCHFCYQQKQMITKEVLAIDKFTSWKKNICNECHSVHFSSFKKAEEKLNVA